MFGNRSLKGFAAAGQNNSASNIGALNLPPSGEREVNAFSEDYPPSITTKDDYPTATYDRRSGTAKTLNELYDGLPKNAYLTSTTVNEAGKRTGVTTIIKGENLVMMKSESLINPGGKWEQGNVAYNYQIFRRDKDGNWSVSGASGNSNSNVEVENFSEKKMSGDSLRRYCEADKPGGFSLLELRARSYLNHREKWSSYFILETKPARP